MTRLDLISIVTGGICIAMTLLWALHDNKMNISKDDIIYISTNTKTDGQIMIYSRENGDTKQITQGNYKANKIETTSRGIYYLGENTKEKGTILQQEIFYLNTETGNKRNISKKNFTASMIYPGQKGIYAEGYDMKQEREAIYFFNEVQGGWVEKKFPVHITDIKELPGEKSYLGISKDNDFKHIITTENEVQEVIGEIQNVFSISPDQQSILMSKKNDDFGLSQNLVVLGNEGTNVIEVNEDIASAIWLDDDKIAVYTNTQDENKLHEYSKETGKGLERASFPISIFVSAIKISHKEIGISVIDDNEYKIKLINTETGKVNQEIKNAIYPVKLRGI